MFYKEQTFGAAVSHVDDKYGIDVDDLYQIEDILAPELTNAYQIELEPATKVVEDEVHLGYLRLATAK